MAAGQAHSPEMRAQVLAALLAGQSVHQAARDFKISRATVSRWRNENGIASRVEPQKAEEIGDLLIDYVRENLATLRVQLETFRDPVWLKKQSAGEAAVLHGVLVDKTVRLLEAFEQSSGDAELAG